MNETNKKCFQFVKHYPLKFLWTVVRSIIYSCKTTVSGSGKYSCYLRMRLIPHIVLMIVAVAYYIIWEGLAMWWKAWPHRLDRTHTFSALPDLPLTPFAIYLSKYAP